MLIYSQGWILLLHISNVSIHYIVIYLATEQAYSLNCTGVY